MACGEYKTSSQVVINWFNFNKAPSWFHCADSEISSSFHHLRVRGVLFFMIVVLRVQYREDTGAPRV